jgi:late competence protein required for DNA uptake (superfamily II DNA/RNA helicase)
MGERILIKVKQGSSQEESQRNLEKALKEYKNKVFKLKITQELRDRKEFLKPSVKKRLQKEKAKSVWLSATPTEDMIRDWKRGELEVSIISRRYHGYPLPEPVFVRLDPLITLLKRQNVTAPLLRKIKTSILRSAQLFIFVSRISDVEPLVNLLRENICPGIVQTKEIDGVSSQESHRTLKITSFRQGAIRILVTTTILERGITIPFSDVIVMDADNERFQTHQLIQIAGRAGRSQEDPHGHVWFCAKTWNKQQKNACAQIKKLNKLKKLK